MAAPDETGGVSSIPSDCAKSEALPLRFPRMLFLSLRDQDSANSDITESPRRIRENVSASRLALVSERIFEQASDSADSGIVSVTTSSSSSDAAIRSAAPPDRTGCVAY